MISNNLNSADISNYWNPIKDVKDEIKIRLITLLSESLANSISMRSPTREERDDTDRFLHKYYGVWKDSRSPEEIIAVIKEGSKSRNPVSFD